MKVAKQWGLRINYGVLDKPAKDSLSRARNDDETPFRLLYLSEPGITARVSFFAEESFLRGKSPAKKSRLVLVFVEGPVCEIGMCAEHA